MGESGETLPDVAFASGVPLGSRHDTSCRARLAPAVADICDQPLIHGAQGQNRVRVFNSSNVIAHFAGSPTGAGGYAGDRGPASSALLASTYGVAVDASATSVYIADSVRAVEWMRKRAHVLCWPGDTRTCRSRP